MDGTGKAGRDLPCSGTGQSGRVGVGTSGGAGTGRAGQDSMEEEVIARDGVEWKSSRMIQWTMYGYTDTLEPASAGLRGWCAVGVGRKGGLTDRSLVL